MIDCATTISINEQMTSDVFRLRFKVGWRSYDPGQFVMISVPCEDAFLRRPFGIVRLDRGEAELCYKVVGKGTRALSRMKTGSLFNVLGPCGKGFVVPAQINTAIFVAGGYGISPFVGLAKTVKEDGADVRIYYGGKSSGDLLYLDDLKGIGATLRLSTEDGSAGEKGLVTKMLEQDLKTIASASIFACGPFGLLTATAKLGIDNGIPTQVSMEEHMACGIGVCLGCVCRDFSGNFLRICREGPVFDAEALKWSSA